MNAPLHLLKEMEQDPVTYTYEEMAGNKQIKIEGLDKPKADINDEE